jgi:hypothetical protein
LGSCFCTAALGVIAVPAAGPELSPYAGPVAATAETGAPSSSIDNATAGTAILHHVEFIGHPPFFLFPERCPMQAVCFGAWDRPHIARSSSVLLGISA